MSEGVDKGDRRATLESKLLLALQLVDTRHQDVLEMELIRLWVKAALGDDVTSAQITVRIVDKEEGRALNSQYRGKDYATNVLTFDYSHAPDVAADLIVCAPVVACEALEQGKGVKAHYAHLIVHGVLHAQGWDHEEEEEALAMEAQESEIMKGLGFADPYYENSGTICDDC